CGLQQTLRFKPLAETLDPMVHRQSLLPHSKSVPALGIDMQLRRLSGGSPGGVKLGALTRGAPVVVRTQDEDRRRIRRYYKRVRRRTVNRRCKAWSRFRIVVESRFVCN